MADYGITPTGFVRKRLDAILADKNAEVQGVFGPDIDLTPQSPDGQINGVLSESDALLWELSQDCYDAFNPDAAVKNVLSNLVQLNGVLRKQASPSTVSLDVTGIDGTVIPQGSLVSTASGIQYTTDIALVVAGGVGTVTATAVVPGSIASVAGTITTIVNPISGWSTVTNPLDADEGLDEETDAELRARRQLSVATPSQSQIESIFSGISALANVVEVIVYENDTAAPDGNGQPAHSIQAIVSGGDDTEIAEAIFNRKPAGITTVGSTTESVDDIQGLPHDINFQRPAAIAIYIIVNLTVDSDYPSDGNTQMKDALVAYGEDLRIQEDVVHSRLYTPINTIPGHTVDSLFIDIAPAPVSTADISIAFDEIAEILAVNIVVNS